MVVLNRFDIESRGVFIAAATLAAVLAGVIFSPGLGGGFMFDDMPNIVENPAMHVQGINDFLYAAFSFEAGGGSRALAMVSFALNVWWSGLDPVAFKVTNLVIHGITCLTLSFVFLRIFQLAGVSPRKCGWAAIVSALLWAIHPLQVSSVLYVVQRMQTLATLFVLLSLLSYLTMRGQQITGFSGRLYGILSVLFAILGFACKEDAVLIPVYCLALELTILQFRAKDAALSRSLRRFFMAGVVVGVLIYLTVLLPHYWHWDSYPGRGYSSMERLLTQARVLVIYLVQILAPLPELMPFHYDSLVVSKSLLNPWTTLPCLLILVALFGLAWKWRQRMPLFSLGVLLFFAGHLITSNIIPLELAFEHRNHFPLIGIVLVVASLVLEVVKRTVGFKVLKSVSLMGLLLLVGSAGAQRSFEWGDRLRLAENNLTLSPGSERAWLFLCTTHYELAKQRGGGHEIGKAVEVCEEGADALPGSVLLMNNVLVFRSEMGTEDENDWRKFLGRLRNASITRQNKGVLWVTLLNAENGTLENEDGILETIDIVTDKTGFTSQQYLRLGAFVFNETDQPVRAFKYLKLAVDKASVSAPEIQKMLGQLKATGLQSWVDRLVASDKNKGEKEDGDE